MSFPLVSVIIPTYNRKEYLQIALESVINQTYKNIEILVIDDGSATNYAEAICNKYSNCNYFYKENGGLSSARNFGIKRAKGKFIAFLDDDDFWDISKIDKQLKVLLSSQQVDCVHCPVAVVDEKGNPTGKYYGAAENKINKRSGHVFWNALGTWVVKSPTPLIRKSVFKEDLMFDETIKVGEDIDFYQRMFYRHKVYYVNEPLAFYREYNEPKRLSLQKEKIIGVETKMIENFKKMGIKNPFVLYKIKLRLAKRAISRWGEFKGNKKMEINIFKLYLNPLIYINKF